MLSAPETGNLELGATDGPPFDNVRVNEIVSPNVAFATDAILERDKAAFPEDATAAAPSLFVGSLSTVVVVAAAVRVIVVPR